MRKEVSFEMGEETDVRSKIDIPPLENSISFINGLSFKKPSVYKKLKKARENGNLLVQPRAGVGSHLEMCQLIEDIESEGNPDISTITIDSYTRLNQFGRAHEQMLANPSSMNGYPLVSQGWQKGRELNLQAKNPIEVRHGSPDGRVLFEYAIASGFTSFEGGGLGYNLPYCKDVKIEKSLACWNYIDSMCGDLAKKGIIVDRELFGTLTAVLIPPSMGLSITLLEAILAASAGVKCISVAICQTGNMIQDIAALRVIPRLFKKFLPDDVEIFPVFHEFMGAFPENSLSAEALILLGAVAAKKGGATKIINKTESEALGIPASTANARGIKLCQLANSSVFDVLYFDEEQIEKEMAIIEQEVLEIVSPILEPVNLSKAIISGFASGQLDIAFSASKYAKSNVIPMRTSDGAIRYFNTGNLSLSPISKKRNMDALQDIMNDNNFDQFNQMEKDIFYFSNR